jgi:hypothetical protein
MDPITMNIRKIIRAIFQFSLLSYTEFDFILIIVLGKPI